MFSAGAPRFSEEKSGAFSPVSLLLVDAGGRLSDAVLPVRKGNCFCRLPSFLRFLDICIGFFVPGKPRSSFLYAFQNDVLKECCFLKIRCIFCLDSICPTCFYERENVPFSATAIPPLFFAEKSTVSENISTVRGRFFCPHRVFSVLPVFLYARFPFSISAALCENGVFRSFSVPVLSKLYFLLFFKAFFRFRWRSLSFQCDTAVGQTGVNLLLSELFSLRFRMRFSFSVDIFPIRKAFPLVREVTARLSLPIRGFLAAGYRFCISKAGSSVPNATPGQRNPGRAACYLNCFLSVFRCNLRIPEAFFLV